MGRTQEQVVRYFLARREQIPGLPRAGESALYIMISRWENGHVQVTEPGYRRMFREFYGRTNEELGFPPEPLNDGLEELKDRLLVARSLDKETLDLFQRQINDVRGSDKRFGPLGVLDQLNAHIRQLESVRAFSVRAADRARLAAILTDARTLAGWTALDRGSQLQAWQYHEDAKVSAREAESPNLLAHAAAQQAVILLDIGEYRSAVELLEFARQVAENRAPTLLRTWLAAAHGEGLAAAGRSDDAMRAFDEAQSLMPADPVDPAMPFLLLNDGHLSRWRGSALLRLGDEDAISQLESAAKALESSPSAAIRGQTGMYVDLAFAYAAAGDRATALEYARKARQLASRIGSDRQRQRLASLELPGGGAPSIT
ncbi:tetratricopeptide repeat protein [Actinosynnema sp. CA-248983]